MLFSYMLVNLRYDRLSQRVWSAIFKLCNNFLCNNAYNFTFKM